MANFEDPSDERYFWCNNYSICGNLFDEGSFCNSCLRNPPGTTPGPSSSSRPVEASRPAATLSQARSNPGPSSSRPAATLTQARFRLPPANPNGYYKSPKNKYEEFMNAVNSKEKLKNPSITKKAEVTFFTAP